MPDFLDHVRKHLPPFGASGPQEAEVVEELAAELQERYDKALRAGEPPADAWRRITAAVDWPALAADFRATLAPDRSPEPPRRTHPLQSVLSDIRFGLRLLTRSRAFAATAILTIALGIGPTTAIFSLLYGVFWAPPYAPNLSRQSVVWSMHPTAFSYGVRGGIHVSVRDFLEWRREATSFERLDAVVQRFATLNDDTDYPDWFQIQSYTPGAITRNYGVHLILGRDFSEEEGFPGRGDVVILSNRYWKQRYHSDRDVLGKQIRLNGRRHTIVGVLGPGSWDRRREPMWPCLAIDPAERTGQGPHFLTVLALRKPGVAIPQAEAEMNSIAVRLAQKYPDTNAGWTVRVDESKNAWLNPRTSSNLAILMGAVLLILLIACLNVANLLLARGGSRLKEVAVRFSMGATKRQIFAQLTTESLVLSVFGGLAGVALGWFLLKIFLSLAPPFSIPIAIEIGLSRPVLLFTLGITLLCGFLFGCAPALQVAGLGIAESLRSGGSRSGVGPGRHHLGRALVVAEFAVALTLLAAAGAVLENYWKRLHSDKGVRTENVLTFLLPTRAGRFHSQAETIEYNRILKEKLEAVPGVVRMTAVSALPLIESGTIGVAVSRNAPAEPGQYPPVRSRSAGPGFFETFGAELLKGRQFDDRDLPSSQRVIMVNETFVRQFLGGLDPLAEELQIPQRPGQPPIKLRIVGVYRDIQNGEELGGPVRPEVLSALSQFVNPFAMIAVRTVGDPSNYVRPIAAAVHEIDREMPLARVRTLDEVVAEATAFDRFETALYGGFGILALLLSIVGIYGLLAYLVSQRTAELGVRVAIGANTASIFRLVIADGLKLATAGLGVGLAGAYYSTKLLQSSLYGMRPVNPASLAGVALLLLIAAVTACVIPAWRAAAVDPLRSLRES